MSQETPVRTLNEIAAARAGVDGHVIALHRPTAVYLQVASGCNLDCYMCTEHLRPPEARRGRGLRFLPREAFDRLCTEVFPWSSSLHIGFGGEPTLAPDFGYFIERGRDCGQAIDLTTNGTRLDRPGLAATLARCVRRLQVSIDAATQETYERIRLGSSWSHLRANLDLLASARAQQSSDERMHLSLVFVLMRSNLHELPAFVELAAQIGAQSVRGQHVIPTTPEGRGETLVETPDRYDEVRALAEQRARELGVEFDAPPPYVHRQGVASPFDAGHELPAAPAAPGPLDCRLPVQQLFVTYEGTVLPCCNPHATMKLRAGDLRTDSFDAIWNNSAYRALRSSLRSGDLHPICASCAIVRRSAPAVPEDPERIADAPTLQDWARARDPGPETSAAAEPLLVAMQRAGLVDHLAELTRERDELRAHARTLEDERVHLRAHAGNLEAERAHLRGHVEALERRWASSLIERWSRRLRSWHRRAPPPSDD